MKQPQLCLDMQNLIFEYFPPYYPITVLNVGSKDNMDNCPNFKSLFDETNWRFYGLDLEIGKDVDIVSAPYVYPFEDNTFDGVFSNQVMEHVEYPWVWMKEMVRILKPMCYIIVSTTWKFKQHRWPVDCWRVLPDGMKAIMKYCGLDPILYSISHTWTFGVGQKIYS